MGNSAPASSWIRWLDQLSLRDLPEVGGKNASLGELHRALVPRGIRVPEGFAVTATAYRRFLGAAGLEPRLRRILAGLDTNDVAELQRRGQAAREAILAAALPDDVAAAIVDAYAWLGRGGAVRPEVAVRSSATAEDLPEASFAGQQETYLNVQGNAALLDCCRRCYASLFTDRAISYRAQRGFDHLTVGLSLGIQRMVRSDLAGAGVLFTLDTESGFPNVVLINASWGLGEFVVQGTVNPDEYVVFKPTLRSGARPILRKTPGNKERKLVYDEGGGRMTRSVPVAAADRARWVLLDDEILELARWGCLIEEHYSARAGKPTPMDIEWAKDGRTGELFVVQARPETVHSQRAADAVEVFRLEEHGMVLASGRAVGDRIGVGPVRIVHAPAELDRVQPGDVLVAPRTDPDWEPAMKRAAAVVTDRGGRTCHAAIVSRELGIPAVVGTEHGTEVLTEGSEVTVSCAEGETGFVYRDRLRFAVEHQTVPPPGALRTRILVNVANPQEAFRLAALPCDGVGLAREEFIISHAVRVHPMALVAPEQVADPADRAAIARLTAGWSDPRQYFVDKLAEGIGTIAAAFWPREVIVRLSDFKTNEYAHLLGGAAFEPTEENPMLGFRGASRYDHPRYRDGFALECQALRKVRAGMGLTNLKVLVPFCRTLDEGRTVLAAMARHGLERGRDGLQVYVMCEIPSNVVLAEEFAELFDGFSIGSNDLTQLVLGVDRDSAIVAPVFDERNPAVLRMISRVIAAARAAGRKIGICGQAPSDYPDFLRWLVEQGIDSISLNPDSVLRMRLLVGNAERALAAAGAPTA